MYTCIDNELPNSHHHNFPNREGDTRSTHHSREKRYHAPCWYGGETGKNTQLDPRGVTLVEGDGGPHSWRICSRTSFSSREASSSTCSSPGTRDCCEEPTSPPSTAATTLESAKEALEDDWEEVMVVTSAKRIAAIVEACALARVNSFRI